MTKIKAISLPIEEGGFRYFKPVGEVEDVIIRVAITADGVPICQYGKKENRSIEAICCTIRSINGVKQSSRAFTQYLSIVTGLSSTKENSFFQVIFDEIVRSTTVMGSVGWYVFKNGKWRHIRVIIEEIIGDYQCLCSLVHHGHAQSDHCCVKCPIERNYYCPLVNAMVRKYWDKVVSGKDLKTIASSFHFLHPKSLYRATTAVCSLGKKKESIVNFFDGSHEDREVWKEEEEEIKHDLQYIDMQYSMQWTPTILPMELMDDFYLNSLAESTGYSEEVVRSFHGDTTNNHTNGMEDKFKDITLLPSRHILSIDGMHTISACVQRCSDYLMKRSKGKNKEKSQEWYGILNDYRNISLNKDFEDIPRAVILLAYQRLCELNTSRYRWILRGFGDSIGQITCEERIIFYFNLFTYMFQDSLRIPVIHYMKKVFCLVARLYTQRGSKSKSSLIQARESYYLGQLQANAFPVFLTTLLHETNHLFNEILYHSPIQDRTCFMYERQYKSTKSAKKNTRYLIDVLARYEMVRGIYSLICYTERKTIDISNCCQHDNFQLGNEYHIHWILCCSLIDDYVQLLDTNKLRKTYTECLALSESESDKWEIENLQLVEQVSSLKWDGQYYKSIVWNSKIYESLTPPVQSGNNANQWILDNQRKIGWAYNSDETVTYYIIRGYVVGTYQEYKYGMAICSPITTYSSDTEVYTPHALIVAKNWQKNTNQIHFVSLYRLHVGCLAYWYGEKTLVGLSVMHINLNQIHEYPNDQLFLSLRKNVV